MSIHFFILRVQFGSVSCICQSLGRELIRLLNWKQVVTDFTNETWVVGDYFSSNILILNLSYFVPFTTDNSLLRCFVKAQVVSYLESTSESSYSNFKGYFRMLGI